MNITELLRRHLRAPAFALTVIVLVAAVTAVNATVFGAIDTLRWKALPYAADDSLVWLQIKLSKIDNESDLNENYRAALAQQRATFRGVAGSAATTRTRSDDAGRPWRIALATPGLDAVLGVAPALGRGITDEDAHDGADRVLVISDALWRRRFGGDPDVVGRAVRFGDRTDTIVGVMPRGFAFPDTQTDAWRPFVPPTRQSATAGIGELGVIARLADGATLAQARDALKRVFDHGKALGALATTFVDDMGAQPNAEPWRAHFFAQHGRALGMLQLAASILLLAVAANLVNLQLDRLLGRRREFDVRRALGADERAIAAQALRDVALPGAVGIAAGLALAVPGMRFLAARKLLPQGLPVELGFDPATLVCGALVALVMLATALLAARLTRGRSALSARGGAAGLGRLRPALLVGQIVLTTALLGSALLLLRSAVNVLEVDRGFDAGGVLMVGIDASNPQRQLADHDSSTDAQLKSAVADLQTRAAALPGVRHVAIADFSPFSGGDMIDTVQIPGLSAPQQLHYRFVSADYFATLGIPLVAGRLLQDLDAHGADGSPVVVDEVYVQRLAQGRDPLTTTVSADVSLDGGAAPHPLPVVGVVRTVKNFSLDERPDMPTMYRLMTSPSPTFILLVRGDGDAVTLVEPVRRLVHERMPDALIAFDQPLAQRVEDSFVARRGLLDAIGAFAAMTLALAAIGLAAVLG
ncbi:MAG TPA: ABC transporter permease, partial [Dokdonella sp.]